MDEARLRPPGGEIPEEQAIYRQFTEAPQESLRLDSALKGFFWEADMEQAHRDAFGAYLRRRIRPAAAALIEQEDTGKLRHMAALGWMDRQLIDAFLQIAQAARKPAALVCLLRIKQETYGFQDRDYSL